METIDLLKCLSVYLCYLCKASRRDAGTKVGQRGAMQTVRATLVL